MNENSRVKSNQLDEQGVADSRQAGQLPEWHPFAVWQTQIRQHQTSQTGQHRVLQSGEIAEV